jgi:hypothetical protein
MVRGIGQAVTEQSVHTLPPSPTGRTADPNAIMAPPVLFEFVGMMIAEISLQQYRNPLQLIPSLYVKARTPI